MIVDLSAPPKVTPKTSRSRGKWIRAVLFVGMTIALYGMIFYTLLFQGNVLLSLLYSIFFFLAFHFAYIELYRLPIRYILLALLFLTGLELLLIPATPWLLVAAIVTINAGIFMFASYLQDETKNKIHFSSRGYFNVGGYIFTVYMTIGYSLVLLSFYNQFPFSCEDLSRVSNQGIDIFAGPLKLGIQQASAIKKDSEKLFTSKIKDVIDIKAFVDSSPIPNASANPLIDTINTYKKTLIDQAIADNHTVNMGICDYILKAINAKYQDPRFLTSVVVMLFLLLYGFIRIVFYVISFIGLIIFKLSFLFGIFHTGKRMEEIEVVE